jgi:hypothetical protein
MFNLQNSYRHGPKKNQGTGLAGCLGLFAKTN